MLSVTEDAVSDEVGVVELPPPLVLLPDVSVTSDTVVEFPVDADKGSGMTRRAGTMPLSLNCRSVSVVAEKGGSGQRRYGLIPSVAPCGPGGGGVVGGFSTAENPAIDCVFRSSDKGGMRPTVLPHRLRKS
jgi:hypothetical protein